MTMLKPVGGSRRRNQGGRRAHRSCRQKIKENGHDLAVYPVKHRVRERIGDYSIPVMWHFLLQHLYVLRVYPDY
jgi:hypothetical protein